MIRPQAAAKAGAGSLGWPSGHVSAEGIRTVDHGWKVPLLGKRKQRLKSKELCRRLQPQKNENKGLSPVVSISRITQSTNKGLDYTACYLGTIRKVRGTVGFSRPHSLLLLTVRTVCGTVDAPGLVLNACVQSLTSLPIAIIYTAIPLLAELNTLHAVKDLTRYALRA